MLNDRFARKTEQQLMAMITGEDTSDEERRLALAEFFSRDIETGKLLVNMLDQGDDAHRIERILDREDLTPEQQAEIVSEAVDLTRFARSMRQASRHPSEDDEEEGTPEEHLQGLMLLPFTDYVTSGGMIADIQDFITQLNAVVMMSWMMSQGNNPPGDDTTS